MKKIAFLVLFAMILLSSCEHKSTKPPYDLGKKDTECISIPYEDLGGIKAIPVKLNGITMNMIYDTGCSGIHLSFNEIQTLLKNGRIDKNDFLGTAYSQIADGSVVENAQINIRRIEIGGEDGIVLENIPATVAYNLDAPILLGNSVLDELASVEVNNIDKTINFIRR